MAGCKLNNKNPKQAPTRVAPTKTISFTPKIIPTVVKNANIIVVTVVASPSIPSVKFTAFVVPSKTNIANGIYSHIGILIYIFKNGIYVAVPIFNTLVKNRVYATAIIKSPSIL